MAKSNITLTIPEPRRAELVERPYPRVIPGYAIVEMAIAPICIEARIWEHHQFEYIDDPDHLGHEGVGTVVEVGGDGGIQAGDRVLMFPGDYCGQCYVCSKGLSPSYCVRNAPPNGEAFHGIERRNGSQSGGFAMQRFRIAPKEMLYKLPDDLDFRYAAAGNCSVGATFTAQEVVGLRPGEFILIGGVGFMGLAHIINALYRGAVPIVLVRNEYRAELCRSLGVAHLIDPDDPGWLEQVHDITNGRGADVGAECSGSRYYQRRILGALGVYGRLHLTGHMPDTTLELHVLHDIVDRHISLTGGHDERIRDRHELVNMLGDRNVQRGIDVMVTHEFPMSKAAEAFEISASRRCGKVYLLPQK